MRGSFLIPILSYPICSPSLSFRGRPLSRPSTVFLYVSKPLSLLFPTFRYLFFVFFSCTLFFPPWFLYTFFPSFALFCRPSSSCDHRPSKSSRSSTASVLLREPCSTTVRTRRPASFVVISLHISTCHILSFIPSSPPCILPVPLIPLFPAFRHCFSLFVFFPVCFVLCLLSLVLFCLPSCYHDHRPTQSKQTSRASVPLRGPRAHQSAPTSQTREASNNPLVTEDSGFGRSGQHV